MNSENISSDQQNLPAGGYAANDMWSERARSLLSIMTGSSALQGGNKANQDSPESQSPESQSLESGTLESLSLESLSNIVRSEVSGNHSAETIAGLRAYLASLPGWSWEKHAAGIDQDPITRQQHGFVLLGVSHEIRNDAASRKAN